MPPPYTVGLVLSLDAALGVYKDAAKSAAATAAGDQVYTWADQSGNGFDVIQAAAANRPLYELSQVNGLPCLRFGSAGVFSNLSNASLSQSSQGQTVFVVYKPYARNTQQTIAGQNAQAFYQYQGLYNTYDGTTIRQAAQGSIAPQRDWQVLAVVFGTSTVTFRQNGVFSITVAASAAATLTNFFLGSKADNSLFINADFAECLLYSSALSGTNLSSVENYLLAKYALPTALPANAPLVVVEGDSLSEGVGTTLNSFEYPEIAYQGAHTASNYNYRNFAVPGSQVTDLTNRASQVDALYTSSRAKNILYVWVGTNDLALGGLTPTNAYNGLVTYCNARRAAGWKVIVRTMIPRASYSDTNRLSFNSLIRSGWTTFADGLDDFGNDPIFGQAGVQTNTTYYQTDQIHLTAAGYGYAATYASAALTKMLYNPGILFINTLTGGML